MRRKKFQIFILSTIILSCLGVCGLAWGDVVINETNFPDANFRSYVSSPDIDTDSDGTLSDSEIAAVTEINVNGASIGSLQGIEYFTALEYLYCHSNQLTVLDVSNNTVLKYLDCPYNQLTTLDFTNNTALEYLYCPYNQLTVLDVSNNTALDYLGCSTNQLTALDVSNNTALKYLGCDTNQLTTLDVSNNTALEILDCESNQLTSLDVSNNTALETLYCASNQLTALDVSKNTALTNLKCNSNQLTALDVSHNTALIELQCGSNQLTALDVTKNTALTELDCSSNQLTALDVSHNTALQSLLCDSNQLTALDVSNNAALQNLYCQANQLTALDVSKNTALQTLSCYSNQLTALDVSKNTALTDLLCSANQLTVLDVSHNTALTYLGCGGNQLTALDLSNNTSLTAFEIESQTIPSIDVEITYENGEYKIPLSSLPVDAADFKAHSVSLDAVDSEYNHVTVSLNSSDILIFDAVPAKLNYYYDTRYASGDVYMDVTVNINGSVSGLSIDATNFPDANFRSYVSNNLDTNSDGTLSESEIAARTAINVEANNVSSLQGIEYFTALQYLWCGSNQLTELDVSKNTALQGLYCDCNQLTALDVTNNTALRQLDCASNQLTALDVSKNTALTFLDCNSNQLTELDVSKNTSLSELCCTYNQLTTLNLNTALYSLQCFNNQLATLDVSKNNSLGYLMCYSNQLTALDISNNIYLYNLGCSENQLTFLDVSKNPSLKSLHCDRNQLISLDISKNTELTDLRCYSNQLTALDVSKNLFLTELYCNSNQLTALDLINNTSLTSVDVSSQDITVTGANITHETTGEYTIPFSEISDASYSNVTSIQAFDDSNNEISLSISSEILSCGEVPAKIMYLYNLETQSGDVSVLWQEMDVTVNIVDPVITEFDNPSPAPSSDDIAVDETTFPDSAFRSYISDFDTNGDGYLSESEINAVTEINVSNKGVASLTGIENFVNLTSLNCSSNDLTEIDVSQNTALTVLDCSNNALTTLDVSKCTALKELICNDNQLTELNVDNNTALIKLYCWHNQLTALNLANNTALEYLDFGGNNISEIDVTNNTALIQLSCGNNQLSKLDVSKNVKLTLLDCPSNQLTALDVTKNIELLTLRCHVNMITALDLTANSSLTEAQVYSQDITISTSETVYTYENGQYVVQINSLPFDVSNIASRLASLVAYDSNGNSVTVSQGSGTVSFSAIPEKVIYLYNTGFSGSVMDVTVNVNADNIPEPDTGIAIDSSEFPDSVFRAYVRSNFDTNSDGMLSASEIQNATEINVQNQGITSLKGIEHFTNLSSLNCSNNALTALDLTSNTALTTLTCSPQYNSMGMSENSSGITIYTVDVSTINLTVSQLSNNVKNLQAFASGGHEITYTIDGGTLFFGEFPVRISYDYYTGFSSQYMSVIFNVYDERPRNGRAYVHNFTRPAGLDSKILAGFSGITADQIYQFTDSEIVADSWALGEADSNVVRNRGEKVIINTSKVRPSKTGVYVMRYSLDNAEVGSTLKLYAVYETEGGNVSTSAVENVEYKFYDENSNEITTVPENKVVYIAAKFDAGRTVGGFAAVPTVTQSVIEPIPEEKKETLAEVIAKVWSENHPDVTSDEIKFVEAQEIFEAPEPSQALEDKVQSESYGIVGKLSTVSVDQNGLYAFKVTLSDKMAKEVEGVSIDELRMYYIMDDGKTSTTISSSSSEAEASFIIGLLNTFELLNMTGSKLQFGAKEFLMVGLLNAGKPMTFYLAKLILALLLGGCNSAFGFTTLFVTGSIIWLKFFRKR